TTMPAHNMLREGEIKAMASYVIFLSIRGQAEISALEQLAKGQANIKAYLFGKTAAKGGRIATLVRGWAEAQDPKLVIRPGPYKYNRASDDPAEQQRLAESVRRGFDLYQTNCGACHKDYGRQAF